jgi:H-type lectin domain
MTSDYIPWKILSAKAQMGVLTEGWNLSEPASDPDGCRQFSLSVSFAYPFSYPPVVHIGLTGFDMDQSTSPRISASVTNISSEGFAIVLTTWQNTLVYSAEVDWLAVGP